MQFQILTALFLLLNSAIASPAASPQVDLDLNLDLGPLDLDVSLNVDLLDLSISLSSAGVTNGVLCLALYKFAEKSCVAGTKFDGVCVSIVSDRVWVECRRAIIVLIESNE
ncbi:hypothetical protein Q9L58_006750 [Maublancomyces gigas]|uniref:Uncharacterized protein n=1 Tax=Discina gigas TaxID=1032678 RepID=A0ABR3GFM9_9PEZI